ncbi:hypothetical protein MMU07_03850 [Aquiflexum sp. LQ15W]|uniref:hypothetical protein n=1 Tax=Cognataquiflexum nitidum TaxID=2922272 RepID=UPI001F13853B|nr:hypothetical protein [Cognataquiflexum nitidum]MCH6198701.1 hypothetical protein [Cognataquiflexum nitidum]
MKKDKADKIMFRLKLNFPWIEIAVLIFFTFIIYISIYKLKSTADNSYYYSSIAGIISLIVFGLLYDFTRKTVLVKDNDITIIHWLTRRKRIIKKEELKGFELRETYDRTGVIKQIRLLTKSDEKIEFVKDNYINYNRLPNGLKKAGISYLGTTELNPKNKYLIGLITKISFSLMIILFFLLQLLKAFK